MLIRKKYRIEMGHLVRNCSSERCAFSQHGHSAVIEVLLSADKLDNAGMVYDFGLMKGSIKNLIDSFDHCYIFWNKESEEFKDYIKKFNHRWIETDFNPTAENLAIFFHGQIQNILMHTIKKNNEDPHLIVASVIYHETESGYAQTEYEDMNLIFDNLNTSEIKPKLNISDISEYVIKDWDEDLYGLYTTGKGSIINPEPFKQIK